MIQAPAAWQIIPLSRSCSSLRIPVSALSFACKDDPPPVGLRIWLEYYEVTTHITPMWVPWDPLETTSWCADNFPSAGTSNNVILE